MNDNAPSFQIHDALRMANTPLKWSLDVTLCTLAGVAEKTSASGIRVDKCT